jgi:hypothetical protein
MGRKSQWSQSGRIGACLPDYGAAHGPLDLNGGTTAVGQLLLQHESEELRRFAQARSGPNSRFAIIDRSVAGSGARVRAIGRGCV